MNNSPQKGMSPLERRPHNRVSSPQGSLPSTERPRSSLKAKARPSEPMLHTFKIPEVPDDVIEWCYKSFSTVSPKCLDDIDILSLKQALVSGGRDFSDSKILEMIQGIGKIEHQRSKFSFREYCYMCWLFLFQQKDEDVGDVREAFQILGGNRDGSGEVNVDRLKEFTRSSELAIDIDRLVADVDDDHSGIVDYEEFRQLFGSNDKDTTLLFDDDNWLRNEEQRVGDVVSDEKGKVRPPAVIVDGDIIRSPSHDVFHTRSPPQTDSAVRSVSSSPKRGLYGENFERSGSRGQNVKAPPLSTSAARSILPNAKKRAFEVSVMTSRKGWKVNACHRNMPGCEGYNSYNIKTFHFRDLDNHVRLRGRGVEFGLKESAQERFQSRPSTEERCRKVLRVIGTAASTEERCRIVLQPVSRSSTPSLFSSLPLQRPWSPFLASRSSRSSVERGGDKSMTPSRDGSKNPSRRPTTEGNPTTPIKAWRTNMKSFKEPLPTEELLRQASLSGMYEGFRDSGIGTGYLNT